MYESGLLKFESGLLKFESGLLKFESGLLKYESGLLKSESELEFWVLWEGGNVFLMEQLYYFINVIIQTLHIRFTLVYVDILHIVNIVLLRCVFSSPRKIALWPLIMHLPQFFTREAETNIIL